MTRLRIIIPLLIVLSIIGGCSSKAVKEKVMDVRTGQPHLDATVLEQESSEHALDPYAYQHYVNGLLYEGMGNLPKAAASFKSALKYHPDSYQLRYVLAETYYRLRQYEQSIKTLDGIIPRDEAVLLLRAASFAELRMDDSARDAYLELLKLNSNSSMAYSHLAGYYRSVGDMDSLIWAYENLARTRPDNERIWRELGRLHARRGDYQGARESFLRSVEIRSDPTNILSYLGLAELYMVIEDTDSAAMMYKRALEHEPHNVVANRELAAMLVRQDSLEAAVPYARRASEATPLDRDASRRLAVIYFGLDSLRLADSVLTYLVGSGERNSINHFYLGRIGIAREDYERAVTEFTTLTQLADSLFESWLDLGYAYGRMKRIDKEILTYQTGLSHMPNEESELKLLFALGAAYEKDDQVDEATKVFEEIIAKSPDHAGALNYLGYMLADRGQRLQYAKDLIEKAVHIAPENAAYLDSYGGVFYRLK
ncbi:MAG: tetratricopeptide repeat protein [Candidatus Zixiibacteriota bacterium]|nr:MAG: tetratricopeptide repeat protein [candidate division Zixibacteria bacterium]